MEFAAKRLLLYAPDVYPWNVISANWDNVLHFPSKAGAGLNEIQFGQIVDAILEGSKPRRDRRKVSP